MPLMSNDVEILSIQGRQIKKQGGGFEPVQEITIRVRDSVTQVIRIPDRMWSKQIADQAILYAAAEIVDLLEKFPQKGA